MGRLRGGLITKIHALVDAEGRPIRLKLTEGQAHDGRSAADMFETVEAGHILLADRAYDSDGLRTEMTERGAWANNHPTPLHFLPKLANELGVGSLALKDEGLRFGIGSFKALGGAYAIVRLALEKASTKMGRELSFEDLDDPDVRAVSSKMTFACATDGNHGRSVAQSAKFVGARSVIFVHGGVCVAALLLLISRRSGRSADRTIR